MWGNEFNCDGSALEAGLEQFIRWNKKVNKFKNLKLLILINIIFRASFV